MLGPSKKPGSPHTPLTLTSLVSALQGLSRADLVTLRAAADRLLNAPAATAGPLYEAVNRVSGAPIPFKAFLATTQGKNWEANEQLVLAWVDATWPKIKDVQKLGLLDFLVARLADDLKDRKIPVSVGSLTLNLGSIPQIFNKCFPGYVGAGLADAVLKAMVRK